MGIHYATGTPIHLQGFSDVDWLVILMGIVPPLITCLLLVLDQFPGVLRSNNNGSIFYRS
jgi:hypothetical protein